MMTYTETNTMRAIMVNLPEIAKQLKIQNKIELLRLKQNNNYVVHTAEIDEISKMLDND